MKRVLFAALAALSLAGSAYAAEPTLEELLLAADDFARGESSHATVEMYVKTSRYERSMKMESWSKGTEKSLIKILEPAKEKGTTTLKVDDNIWNYLPKVDRTMKVPAGMMGGSWMGSHMTNDDLVAGSRLSEDFEGSITKSPEKGDTEYQIELIPKPDAPVVWGKIVLRITPDKIPLEQTYYDEKGALVRTMTFDEVKEIDGRKLPTRMTMVPADKPDEMTRFSYAEIAFDVGLEDSMFSLQALKK